MRIEKWENVDGDDASEIAWGRRAACPPVCRVCSRGRLRRGQEGLRRSAAAVRLGPALGVERHAHRGAGRGHAPRSGRPEGQAGLCPSPAGPDDALSGRRLVPPLEARPAGGGAARHEPLDLRRELLSLGLCRRLGAGADARVPRPRPGDPRGEAARQAGAGGRRHLPRCRPRVRERHGQGPRRTGPARGPLRHRRGSPGGQFALARQPLLRGPDVSGRDREVPRRDLGGLPAGDRR